MPRHTQSPHRPKTGQKQRKRKKKKQEEPQSPEDKREEQLRYLQEVFKEHIEPTLVHSLFEDYNSDVTKVLETLITLTGGSNSDEPGAGRKIPSFKDITDHLTRGPSDSSEEGSGGADGENGGYDLGEDDIEDSVPEGRDAALPTSGAGVARSTGPTRFVHRPLETPGPDQPPAGLPDPDQPHPGQPDSTNRPSRRAKAHEDGLHKVGDPTSPLSYHNVRYLDEEPAPGGYGRTDSVKEWLADAGGLTQQYGYSGLQTTAAHTRADQKNLDDLLAEAKSTNHSKPEGGSHLPEHSAAVTASYMSGRKNLDELLAEAKTADHPIPKHESSVRMPSHGTVVTPSYASGQGYGGQSHSTVGVGGVGLPSTTAPYTAAPIHTPAFQGNSYLSTYYGGAALGQSQSGLHQGRPNYTTPVGLWNNQPDQAHKVLSYGQTPGRTMTSNFPRKHNPSLGSPPGGLPAQPPIWQKKTSHIIPSDRSRPQPTSGEFRPLPSGNVLCLMRGLPGSGKSTLARMLLRDRGRIISTDHYFIKGNGVYTFNPCDLEKAHLSAQKNAKKAMEQGVTPIIIDNTNTQLWEMKPYVQLAQICMYRIEVREPNTPWRRKVRELAKRNTHGVPAEKIQMMLERFEPLHDIASILEAPDKKDRNKRGTNDTKRHEPSGESKIHRDGRTQGSREDHGRTSFERANHTSHTAKPRDVAIHSGNTALNHRSEDGKELQRQSRLVPVGSASSEPDQVREQPIVTSASQSHSSHAPPRHTTPDPVDSRKGRGSDFEQTVNAGTRMPQGPQPYVEMSRPGSKSSGSDLEMVSADPVTASSRHSHRDKKSHPSSSEHKQDRVTGEEIVPSASGGHFHEPQTRSTVLGSSSSKDDQERILQDPTALRTGHTTFPKPPVEEARHHVGPTDKDSQRVPGESVIAKTSQVRSPRSGYQSGSGESITRSNLSEKGSATSIPIASGLEDQVRSFERKLADFDIRDIKSSSSGEHLPVSLAGEMSRRTSENVVSGIKSGPNQSATKGSPKVTTSKKVYADKYQHSHLHSEVDTAIRGKDRMPGTVGGSGSDLGIKSNHSVVPESSFVSEYLTQSEKVDDPTGYSMYQSHKIERRLLGSGTVGGNTSPDLDSVFQGTLVEKQQRSHFEDRNFHDYRSGKDAEDAKGLASSQAGIEGRQVSPRSASNRTPRENGHLADERSVHGKMGDGQRVDKKEQGLRDEEGPTDHWEDKGAKPKMKRTISEPFKPLVVSEDPGPGLSSPERFADPAPFMSLATVPQMKRRQGRSATPFRRRHLAPNFSTSALPSVSEQARRDLGGHRIGITRSKSDDIHGQLNPDELDHDDNGYRKRETKLREGRLGEMDVDLLRGRKPQNDQPLEGRKSMEEDSLYDCRKNKEPTTEIDVHSQREVGTPVDVEQPAESKPSPETPTGKSLPVRRKVARAPRTKSPPLLSPETRQKALTQDWSTAAITKEFVPPQEVLPQKPVPHDPPEMRSQTSQTDPAHFRIVERVNLPQNKEPIRLGTLRMVRASPVPFKVADHTTDQEDIPYRRKIDQSTMTDEALGTKHEMSLKVLCDIFPQFGREEIKSLLDRYNGNVEMVSEILLTEDSKSMNARERRRRNRAESKPVPRAGSHANQQDDALPAKSSQTTRPDLLLLKLIGDGFPVDNPTDITIITARSNVSITAFGGVNMSNSEGPRRTDRVDVGTIADFDETMPNFDQDLARLLDEHEDKVSFLEVCRILEDNQGDAKRADVVIRTMVGSGHGAVGNTDGAGLGNTLIHERDRVSQLPAARRGEIGNHGRRPEPLGQPLNSGQSEDDEKAVLSDQELPQHRRGRSEHSRAQISKDVKRRTRSLPRASKRRPQSPRTETKMTPGQKSQPTIPKSLMTTESMQAGLKKDERRRHDSDKQPKRTGLSRNHAGRENSLPNKYGGAIRTHEYEQSGDKSSRRPADQGWQGKRDLQRAEDIVKTQSTPTREPPSTAMERVPTPVSQGAGKSTTSGHTEGTKERGKKKDKVPVDPPGANLEQGGDAARRLQGDSHRKKPAVGKENVDDRSSKTDADDLVSAMFRGDGKDLEGIREKRKDMASCMDTGRLTPAAILAEEGKGVPARFHGGMTFQLDMAFALQLQEIFGPVALNIDTDVLSENDLMVSVDLELAKTLHTAWSKSFKRKFDREEEELMKMMREDEALAKQLQQEEELKRMEEIQKKREAKYRGQATGSPVRSHSGASAAAGITAHHRRPPIGSAASGGPEKLQEIMDTEMAEEMSREMQEEDVAEKGTTMAVNIRRNQLHEKYPTADKSWLENIFMINHYDFEATVESIDEQMGAQPPRNVFSAEALMREEERQLAQAKEQSQVLQSDQAEEQEIGDELQHFKSGNFQSLGHPGYRDYRAEANTHYRQRQECFRKASEAFNKGQREQAAYYSQQGHRHTALLQEANQRASEAILAETNKERDANTIDLHGLHVDEVIPALQQKIEERQLTLRYSSPHVESDPYLNIITGKGNNSKGGIARIKPKVIGYLKMRGIRYELLNQGLLRIKVTAIK